MSPQPLLLGPSFPFLRVFLFFPSRNGPYICLFFSSPESGGHRNHASVSFPYCGKTHIHTRVHVYSLHMSRCRSACVCGDTSMHCGYTCVQLLFCLHAHLGVSCALMCICVHVCACYLGFLGVYGYLCMCLQVYMSTCMYTHVYWLPWLSGRLSHPGCPPHSQWGAILSEQHLRAPTVPVYLSVCWELGMQPLWPDAMPSDSTSSAPGCDVR